MNIQLIKRILYASFLTLMLGSCSKSFLEITPKGQIIAQTTVDYDLLLNNFSDLGNQVFQYHQDMGDELAAFEPYFIGLTQQQQRAFSWEDNIFEVEEDAQEITYPMKALYYYNIIINEVMNSAGGTEQQKLSIQAEAFAGRAWTYLHLVNIFGKPYSASASTDPGFPILTSADVSLTNFKRPPIQEVYDFIINDLQKAIPNLPATPLHRFRMSRPAAQAILGKTYLFMGKFDEALEQLNGAISDISNSTYPVLLYDYNFELGPNGSFFVDPVFGPSTPNLFNYRENLYARQTFGEATGFSNALLLRPEAAALYGASDMRLKFTSPNPFPAGNAFPLGMLQRLAPFAPIIGMNVPDVYLMRAEVKARLNDLEGAREDVEALRVNRMPAGDAVVPDAIASDRTALVKFILDERIREFAGLGYRWFDMRRLSVDAEFQSTINNTHVVYGESGDIISTFTLKPERLTLKIPPKVLNQNLEMQDNP